MTLTAGTNLGPYEILSPLGAGGMGEVYRARDTKLGPDVALKVLPEAFAQDAQPMARFEREAQESDRRLLPCLIRAARRYLKRLGRKDGVSEPHDPDEHKC
jgi:serine/threonine protein kinase